MMNKRIFIISILNNEHTISPNKPKNGWIVWFSDFTLSQLIFYERARREMKNFDILLSFNSHIVHENKDSNA